MIEYMVIKHEDPQPFDYGRARVQGATGRAFTQHTVADDRGYDFSPRASIYWAHTLVDAEVLADALTKRHIGTTWVVGRSHSVFQTIPGPQQRSVFTDGGLLPE